MIIWGERNEVRHPTKLARTFQHCPNHWSDPFSCSIANTCRPNYHRAQTLQRLARGNKVRRCRVQWSLSRLVRSLTMRMAKCALQDRRPQSSRTIKPPSTKVRWSRQTRRTWKRQVASSRVLLHRHVALEITISKTASIFWLRAMPGMEMLMMVSRSILIKATQISKGISVFTRRVSRL